MTPKIEITNTVDAKFLDKCLAENPHLIHNVITSGEPPNRLPVSDSYSMGAEDFIELLECKRRFAFNMFWRGVVLGVFVAAATYLLWTGLPQ